MHKKFVSNLAFLLVLNFIVKPVWIFGIDRTVQNTLGTEEYGAYFALLNFTFLFNIILDLGITNFNNRNIAQNKHLVSKHLFPLLNLKIALGGIYTVIVGGIALLVGYSTNIWPLLLILLTNQILVSLILFVRSNYSALQLFKQDSVLSILDKALMIAFGSFLLFFDEGSLLSIKSFALIQTAAYFIALVVGILSLRRKVSTYSFKIRIPFSIALLKQSMPFALLIMLMMFYNRTDSVMLERLHPDGAIQAGVYAQGYRLFEAINMISFLFASLLLPMFSDLLGRKESVKQLLETAVRVLGSFSVLIVVFAIAYSDNIMTTLYNDVEQNNITVFIILFLNVIPVSATYIYGTLLTASGSLKQLNRMALFGVTLNIALNYFLIPEYGAYGAAIATLFTQFLTAGIQWILVKRILNESLNLKLWLVILLIGLLAFIGQSYLSTVTSNWGVILVSGLSISIALPLLFRVMAFKDVISILKLKQKPQ